MLVLSRQRDETIVIGDDVQVTIVDIRGDKVRLGISAPSNVTVHRKEIYDQIQRENAEGAALQPSDLPLPPVDSLPISNGHAKAEARMPTLNGKARPAVAAAKRPKPAARLNRPD